MIANGAHPDPDKISAIRDLPSPSTVVELQHILGIVTYLSPFIQDLANQTASLRELQKKYTEYDWTESHESAFRTLKSAICNDSVLAYFDPEADTTIQVDASGKGIGVILMQNKKPRLQTTQPTSGGAVTADSSCCAICVEPPRPQQWGPDLPFLGMPAMRTRWMAGAAAHKSG